jgi:hypothetical protein
MKLQDDLPHGVTVNGKTYRMNFDFRRVLKMMEYLDRSDLFPGAREHLALSCVMRRPRGDKAAILAAVMELLFPRDGKTMNREKITDFVQDADMIRAAFWQEYGINLYRAKLHWLEFRALLHGLPNGSRYTETLSIRARPMPAATKYNQAEREWLMKAKEACALEMSDDEKKRAYMQGVKTVFTGMLALAEGGKTDG